MSVPDVARELGISRNAVYQHIQRMRRNGSLPEDYTPTGQPVREKRPGQDIIERLLGASEHDEHTGMRALAAELGRVRDELDVIVHRITAIIPR